MRHWIERIRHHGLVEPEATAIITSDRAVTFGMLRQAIDSVNARVTEAGLAPGAACTVLMDNPIRQIAVCLALHQSGIPYLSLEAGQSGLEGMAGSSIDTMLYGAGVQVPAALAALRRLEVTNDWFQSPPARITPAASKIPAASKPILPPPPAQVVRYALTSGSTGEPKLVTYTADYVAEQLASKLLTELVPVRRGVLVMLGMSSNVGFLSACATLAAGRMACLVESAEQALRMIDLHAIDAVRASVEQVLVLTRTAKAARFQLSSLERIDCIGGRASRVLLEQATQNLCRRIRISYGSSETGRIAMAPANEVLERPGLVGYPLPGIEVAVVDANLAALPAGGIGNVLVRKAELAAPLAIGPDGRPGWATPGDIGWFDPEGRLYVAGRSSDGTAAQKGWSDLLEVEHLFRLGTDANDAAAIEIDDPSQPGARLICIAMTGEPGPGADPTLLAQHLAARGIAKAIRIVPVDAIPRGANGKVRRALLNDKVRLAMMSGRAC